MTDQIAQEPAADADDYALDARFVTSILLGIAAGDAARIAELTDALHCADIADLLEQLAPEKRRELMLLAPGVVDGEVLSELDESLREEIIAFLPTEALGEALRELESDDVVDLIEDLEEHEQEALLDTLEDADRAAVEAALSYPEFSAGRLMQREVVAVPEHWDVGTSIDHMRARDDLPEAFYHVILVDPRHRPTGYATLGKIMGSRRLVPLRDICEDSFRTIPATQDEGDVAYAFNQYHLISAPVVDEDGRLAGVITIDDAMVVLDEEHEEDVLRLGGVGDESLSDRTMQIFFQRLPWLGVNLLTAILASLVIAQFEDTIAVVVALAVLMPIVASMGGNAGTQSLTVAVRALATKDLTGSNALRVVMRETAAGLLNGIVFGIVMAVVAVLWFGMPVLGLVIAAAMVVNLIVAGLAGVLVPIALERTGIDPALASGTFVTTVTDVVGFFAFLGLAGAMLL
ncbi:MAG: magnesium transporter [Pseudomonadota bacterium]